MTEANNNRWNKYLKSLNLDSTFIAWEPDVVLVYKTSPSPNNDGQTCFPDNKGLVCKLRKTFLEKIKQKGIISETLDYQDYGYTMVWIPYYMLCEEAEYIKFRVQTRLEVDLESFTYEKIEIEENKIEISNELKNENVILKPEVPPNVNPTSEVQMRSSKTSAKEKSSGKKSPSKASVGKTSIKAGKKSTSKPPVGKTSAKGREAKKTESKSPAKKAPTKEKKEKSLMKKGKSKNNNLYKNYAFYRHKFKRKFLEVGIYKNDRNKNNFKNNFEDNEINQIENMNNNYLRKTNEVLKKPQSNQVNMKSRNFSSNNPEFLKEQVELNKTNELKKEEVPEKKNSSKCTKFFNWLSMWKKKIVGIKDTEHDNIYLPLTLRNYEFCYNWKNVPLFFPSPSRGILALSILNSIDSSESQKVSVSNEEIETLFPIHYSFCFKKNLNFLISIGAFNSYFWIHNKLNLSDEQVIKEKELLGIVVPELQKHTKCAWSGEDLYAFKISEKFEDKTIRIFKGWMEKIKTRKKKDPKKTVNSKPGDKEPQKTASKTTLKEDKNLKGSVTSKKIVSKAPSAKNSQPQFPSKILKPSQSNAKPSKTDAKASKTDAKSSKTKAKPSKTKASKAKNKTKNNTNKNNNSNQNIFINEQIENYGNVSNTNQNNQIQSPKESALGNALRKPFEKNRNSLVVRLGEDLAIYSYIINLFLLSLRPLVLIGLIVMLRGFFGSYNVDEELSLHFIEKLASKQDNEFSMFYSFFIVIWFTLTAVVWNQRFNYVLVKWSNHNILKDEFPQMSYQKQPMKKMNVWLYVCSVMLIVNLLIQLPISCMLMRIDFLKNCSPASFCRPMAQFVTTLFSAIQLGLIDFFLSFMAVRFTVIEKHNNNRDYYKSLITKVIIFKFINWLSILFYSSYFREELSNLFNKIGFHFRYHDSCANSFLSPGQEFSCFPVTGYQVVFIIITKQILFIIVHIFSLYRNDPILKMKRQEEKMKKFENQKKDPFAANKATTPSQPPPNQSPPSQTPPTKALPEPIKPQTPNTKPATAGNKASEKTSKKNSSKRITKSVASGKKSSSPANKSKSNKYDRNVDDDDENYITEEEYDFDEIELHYKEAQKRHNGGKGEGVFLNVNTNAPKKSVVKKPVVKPAKKSVLTLTKTAVDKSLILQTPIQVLSLAAINALRKVLKIQFSKQKVLSSYLMSQITEVVFLYGLVAMFAVTSPVIPLVAMMYAYTLHRTTVRYLTHAILKPTIFIKTGYDVLSKVVRVIMIVACINNAALMAFSSRWGVEYDYCVRAAVFAFLSFINLCIAFFLPMITRDYVSEMKRKINIASEWMATTTFLEDNKQK